MPTHPRLLAARSRFAVAAGDDDGLTLIEMVVALLLVTMILVSFVGVSIAGVTSSREAEARSRANQAGNQEVESFKSTPWTSLGLYDNDRTAGGASPAATCGSETVVSLGSTAPNPRTAPAFQRVAPVDGRQYTITDCITWRDDPADGTVAAGNELNNDQGHDVKHLVTTISWTLLGKTRTITFDELRSPTIAEVPPVQHSTATLALTPGTPSPTSQQLAANGTLTSPLSLAVTASLAATAVTVTYSGQSGSVTTNMTTSDGGLHWALTIPAGPTGGTFNAGTLALTYQGTSASGSAQANNSVTLTAPPTPFTVTVTASPTSVFLDSSGYLTSAITINVTTSQVASSVSVSFPWASGTGSRGLTNSSGGTSWQVVLPAGASSGTFAATSNELFTVTATNGSGSVTGTATVTLSPPAAAPVTYVSGVLPYVGTGFPNGKLCVKNSSGNLFGAATFTVMIDNVVSTDTVTVTWTSDAGSATPATRSTSGTRSTFTFTVPASFHFSSTASTFTIAAKRLSDNAGMTQVVSMPVDPQPNSGKC